MEQQENITKKIACAIIETLCKNGIYDTTQLKVNKLTYFVYTWYCVFFGEKDFEKPKAYKKGPVFVSLRKEFGNKGYNPIFDDNLKFSMKDIDDNTLKTIIENVIKQYGRQTARELSEKTHTKIWEDKNRSKNQTMEWKDIIEYYKNHLLEAVNIEYDSLNNVYIATSDIIQGLVLESDNLGQLKKDIQENGEEIIKLNYATNIL